MVRVTAHDGQDICRRAGIGNGTPEKAAQALQGMVDTGFLIPAGIHHDASQTTGFGGAFLFLLAQPYGRVLVGVIGLGFVALGLHSFACARWVRLMGSAG